MIEIRDDKHWHELRARHVGGSEVAALFGLSPFLTHYTLWHQKAGKVPREDIEDERKRWGKMLEPLLAQEIGRTLGWRLERSKQYHVHPLDIGMGCTLDFDVLDHQWGPGVCETKVVFEYADYKKDWSEERAPPNYELQVQHQLACTGYNFAAIACFCAQTATLFPPIIRRRNEGVISVIETKIAAFWDSIGHNIRPEPSGTEAELAIMRAIWPERAPRKVVEASDGALNEAASLYLWASEQLPGLERERTHRKAQLLNAAQDAELLIVPGFRIGVKQDRRGYVRLDVQRVENDLRPTSAPSTLAAG